MSIRKIALLLTVGLSAIAPAAMSAAQSDADKLPAPASEPDSQACPPNRDRPCIALVLGGGGARGGAHVGVLKALEEQGIPVDLVVGTSIGAFVGGLYASGKSAAGIELLFRQADWNAGYRDDLNRSKIPNRRKRQLENFPIHLDLGFGTDGIKLPQGFLQGQGMKALVDTMLGPYRHFQSFDDLPIPFRAIAADIESGEEVVLASGDLATALQVSMSLPGVLRPTEVNGHLLVDGGIANNLPISVAKALGADIVIAVDIGSPNKDRDALGSGLTILSQLSNFLTRKNVEYQKSLLTDRDVYLHLDIETVGMLSFDRVNEAIDAGYREAQLKLTDSSLPRAALTPVDPAQGLTVDGAVRIDAITLVNDSRLGGDYILDRMELTPGNSYTLLELQESVERLYGQGTIARINTSIETIDDDGTVLDLYVGEKDWGPGYLDFKLSFEDDFSSFSRYQLGAAYRLTNLSPYGAEWYTTAEFGTDKALFSELYWPIKTTGFFWDANGTVERIEYQYRDEDVSLGEYTVTQNTVKGGLGWNSVDRFDTLLSAVAREGEIELPDILAVTTTQDELDFQQYGAVLTVNYDTLDHANFPRQGVKLAGLLQRTRDEIEKVEVYSTQVDVEINAVTSIGRSSVRGLLRYQSTLNNNQQSLLGSFSLGGFLNLSGVSPDAISGQHVRYASLVYTYEVAANDFGAIELPLYLGMSAETGNAWADKHDIDYGDMVTSGSVFVGWDSPIGPAYLAYGQSNTGYKSLYVFLGYVF